MRNAYGTRVLVTGATSGIGKQVADALRQEGLQVIGASRSAEGEGLVRMDVTDEASVQQGVACAVERMGGIDIVVNCAGMGIAGACEDVSEQELQQQMDTNFMGMARVCRAVLPVMREQKKGILLNIGSVAGFIPIPFQAAYAASKGAVASYSAAMRMEAEPFGVKVCVIEPGDTKTGFTGNRKLVKGALINPAYREMAERAIYAMEQSEKKGKDPQTVVREVKRLIGRKNPPVRRVVGWEYKLIYIAQKLLPMRLLLFVLKKMYMGKPVPQGQSWDCGKSNEI